MMKFVFALVLLSVAGIAQNSSVALAQEDDQMTSFALKKPSSAQDVAVLFFRLAGIAPKFGEMLRLDPAVQQLPLEEQGSFIEKKKLELDVQYANLDPKKSPIIIRSAVRVWPVHGKTPGLKIELPKTEIPYFPYSPFGQSIAVIPDNLDSYAFVPLSKTELAIAAAKIDLGGVSTLVLALQPITADMKTPVVLDSLPQWPLLTDIGYFGLYNKRLQAIWSEKAPWFTGAQDDLINLRATKPDLPTKP